MLIYIIFQDDSLSKGFFNDSFIFSSQVGVEVETNLRMAESVATFGYQIDLPKANLVFRGRVNGELHVFIFHLPIFLSNDSQSEKLVFMCFSMLQKFLRRLSLSSVL